LEKINWIRRLFRQASGLLAAFRADRENHKIKPAYCHDFLRRQQFSIFLRILKSCWEETGEDRLKIVSLSAMKK